MKIQSQPWTTWQPAARSIYKLLGWPRDEMRQYFNAGMSPQEAVEKAHARRKMPRTAIENKEGRAL